MDLPLNALRAFEVSARHLSFTRAAQELNLTQTAVSQHVKNLEQRLGKPLFRRVPRGLALTDEGMALLPTLVDAFARVSATLESFKGAHKREVLSVGAVGTFAVGWLLPRLRDFQARHPFVELRLFTHNNRIDLAAEGLDCAIRFGDGQWPGLQTRHLLAAPLAPVGAPALAHRIRAVADLGARRCCAPTARTSGRSGSRQWAGARRCSPGRCSTLRWCWPMPPPRARAWPCCRCRCSPATCRAGGWCACSRPRWTWAATGSRA